MLGSEEGSRKSTTNGNSSASYPHKVHLTETCDQQEEAPHLIVHVETTPSTIQDSEMLVPICQGTRERGLAAREHLVDQGYTSGEALATQREHGTEIIGPVAQAPSWQGRAQTGYAPEDFELNWQTKVATCPQGQHSVRWKTTQDRRDKEILVIQFDARHCQGCPVQSLCTHNQEGRRLTLTPQASQQALIQRREEQQTKEFGQRYGLRAGIEGTISQAIRTMGGRRSRYQGLAKTQFAACSDGWRAQSGADCDASAASAPGQASTSCASVVTAGSAQKEDGGGACHCLMYGHVDKIYQQSHVSRPTGWSGARASHVEMCLPTLPHGRDKSRPYDGASLHSCADSRNRHMPAYPRAHRHPHLQNPHYSSIFALYNKG